MRGARLGGGTLPGMDAPAEPSASTTATARFTYEVVRQDVLTTASLRREWGLLDASICGVRELEPSMVPVRVTILDSSGAPERTVDAAYYPEIRQLGVSADPAAPEPDWMSAPTIKAGIERWLKAR